ncbi:MAG: 2,5-dihydroxypyridine 5,6-dioxygenase [Thermoleophilia bacterium]|nr:2,5-dihydroxypyridine 5,6-dioxygenase [Thermoleophilia bacterium]
MARIGARLIELPIASQMTVRAPSILRGMGGTATLDGASLERIKAADILFDITAEGLLWSPALGEVLASGTRTVMAIDPPEALQRMFPSQELKLRALANGERLGRAKTLRVVSDAGTDLTCELGQYAARARYGFSDEAGHWDHWPSGMVATFPNDGTPEGVIVANEGDVPLPFSRYLSAPVRFVFEKGILTSIEGGFDARLIRDFIDSWHDPRGYDFSHLGWGLQRRANWAAIALFEGERMMCQDIRTFEGNFLFSTGPNEVAGRFTPCHLDIACRDVTLLLDDEVIVENGVVKPESLQ